LFSLAKAGLLPKDWRLVGNGRGDVSHVDFQEQVKASLEEFGPKPAEGPWDDFRNRLLFAGGGFGPDDPGRLLDVIGTAEQELTVDGKLPQRVHYLAVPPGAFAPLTEGIGTHGLAARSRIVYEKPFGTSLDSFRQLDRTTREVFEEHQIYRIDHFLGKEATQDIHVLRFANGLFSAVWNRDHIERVEIDVPETLDVGMRADFYEHTGAFLDMVVTHLFQVAGEVAMEPPASIDAAHIARAREEVIGCFRPLTRDDVVVGQYEGYRSLKGVAPDSRTETFVALRLWVDNARWRGVPFLLRTGKCLAASRQRVRIVFKDPPKGFANPPEDGSVLSFELSGEGEIDLTLVGKRPGPELQLDTASARLPLGQAFHTPSLPAYSRLIHDVLLGDRSLFTRPDGIGHVWTVVGSLLEDKVEPIPYPRGSWGPAAWPRGAPPMLE